MHDTQSICEERQTSQLSDFRPAALGLEGILHVAAS